MDQKTSSAEHVMFNMLYQELSEVAYQHKNAYEFISNKALDTIVLEHVSSAFHDECEDHRLTYISLLEDLIWHLSERLDQGYQDEKP